MASLQGFELMSEYFDDKHFPNGFKRSGDFTIPEANILSQLGSRLTKLTKHEVEPISIEEKQFVEMCIHNLQPQNPVEKAWAKYQNLITTGKPMFTLHARAEDVEDDPSLDDDL